MAYHPFGHLGLKALSVGIAVLLWLTVAGEPMVERILRVPLELQNIPSDLVVVESPPAQVDVRVRGASSALTHLSDGDVVAVLEMEYVRPGRRLFSVTPAQVRAPFGVEIEQVTPGTVAVTFERSGVKVVSVQPVVEGEPAEGYVIGAVASDPPTVEVVGPQSALTDLTHAVTEGVSVQGASRTVRGMVTIGVGDARLRLSAPQIARVTITIVAAPVERTIPGVALELHNVPQGRRARATPPAATVVLRGPGDRVSALGTAAVTAFVDVAGLGRGRHTLPVQVVLPQDLEMVRTQPATVTVTVQ